jgi:sugar porter (SP) family MFS transporter
MQSFLQGYIFMALNPALVMGDLKSSSACYDGSDASCPVGSIYNDLQLSTLEVGLATSLALLGGLAGCILSMKPGELYGRKYTIMMNNTVFILGAVLSSLGNKSLLFVGRFISGLGVGCTSVLAPILLAEMSPAAHRGTITTMHQVNVTLAILVASFVGYFFVTYEKHGWQWCQGVEVIPCIIMLLGYKYVPESPKWLVAQGRADEALEQLKALRNPGDNLQEEINTMTADSKSSEQNATVSWREVFSSRRGIIIGCMLMFIQAFTGINTVVFYSTTIFGFAGFKQAILATSSFASVNFLATIFSAYIIDIYGRKILLFSGTCIMFVSLVILSAALLSDDSSNTGLFAVMAVLLYVFGFAIGLGAVVWVMMSELIPTRSRSKAVSLFLTINWVGNFCIGLFSLEAINGLGGVTDDMSDDATADAEKQGVGYLYIIFAATSCMACFYIWFQVPETKGKNPEDFQDDVHRSLIDSEAARRE